MTKPTRSARLLEVLAAAALVGNVAFVVGPSLLGIVLEPPSASAATDPAKPADRPATATPSSATPGESNAAPPVTGPVGAPSGVEAGAKPEAPSAPPASSSSPPRAGADTAAKTDGQAPGSADEDDTTGGTAVAEANRLFRRIVRAYENMEPENASAALVLLADRDMYSTVKTLLAMDPRKSGAILDAMSRRSPQKAATITSEMLGEATPAAFQPAR